MDRRAHLLQSAIAVLARGGARSLTHRAVDDEAGLAPGSTSNVFRTRHTLVTAVVEVLLERSARRLHDASSPSSSPGATAAAFVERTLAEAVDEVRARMALLMDPDAGELVRARARLLDAEGLGARTPLRRIVVAAVDGILFDAVLLDHAPRGDDVRRAVDAMATAGPTSP